MNSPAHNVHVLIPKQLRLDWVDVLTFDRRLSHIAVRTGSMIGQFFDKKNGTAFIGFPRLAELLGVSERSAWGAVNELEVAGYLKVKHGHGKGRANEYSMAVDNSQQVASLIKKKVAAICELLDGERRNGLRVEVGANSQNGAPQLATSCDPSLTSPSESSLTGDLLGLGRAGDLIANRIGPAMYSSWFRGVQLVVVDEAELLLCFRTVFAAHQVRDRYGEIVLDCFQADRPTVQKVTIVGPEQRTA